jgi:predicted metal-dependent HD superfamily phosphohydrolase
VVQQSLVYAGLGGDGGDGRPAAALRAEDAGESSHDLAASLLAYARPSHRLVVPPIYRDHGGCMPNDVAATQLLERLSLDVPPGFFDRLAARYAEPHRRYHIWTHVLACLQARLRITEASLPDVDLALVFHDAVYEPLAFDNEERSAELLVEEGRRAWINEGLLRRAHALVVATKHSREPTDMEEASIVLDADLSILGADPATFAAYEAGIRHEYASVDDAAYRAGRAAVLQAFLARQSIYSTRTGRRLWEASARRNIEESIARLSRE